MIGRGYFDLTWAYTVYRDGHGNFERFIVTIFADTNMLILVEKEFCGAWESQIEVVLTDPYKS